MTTPVFDYDDDVAASKTSSAEMTPAERARADARRRQATTLADLILSEPASIEAEQALLGILLYEGSTINLLPGALEARSFFEPFHQRLFASIQETVAAGYAVDPILLYEELRGDDALDQLGGIGYFTDLVDKAPPAANAVSYAKVIAGHAMRREVIQLGIDMAATASADLQRDGAEIIALADAKLMAVRARDRRDDAITIADAVEGTMAYVDDRQRVVGISTGFAAVDRQIGPWLPKDLIVLGGATGMGKSMYGVAIAQNVADPALASIVNGRDPDPTQRPRGVIEIHAEMTYGDRIGSGQAIRRHFADVGYHMFGKKFPTYAAIRSKNVSTDQRAMMAAVGEVIGKMPVVGLRLSRPTVARARTVILRQIDAWGRAGIEPGLVMADHMGLFRTEKPQSPFADQSAIAIATKELADELGLPFLALVQLSRADKKAEDKRPTLNDIKNSGEWENSADVVMLAYRDSYYAQREPDIDETKKPVEWAIQDERRRSKEMELIIPKIREGAGGGGVKLWGDIAWNAVRGAEPKGAEGLL